MASILHIHKTVLLIDIQHRSDNNTKDDARTSPEVKYLTVLPCSTVRFSRFKFKAMYSYSLNTTKSLYSLRGRNTPVVVNYSLSAQIIFLMF